jgi:isopentenyl-diphosphate Delta-isomerase
MISERITIVNDLDKVIGFGDYNYIHTRGILHRFVSIFLLDNKRRILIQKRAHSKYHGNLFSESVSAHVKENEDYSDTAIRKLKEELGLENITLREMCKIKVDTKDDKYNWRNYAFVKVFEGNLNQHIIMNPSEVQQLHLLSLNDLLTILTTSPYLFVPGFKAVFESYLKNK